MPTNTATIDRDQRDGLYELVRNHLGAIGDIWIALEESADFATAERLGLEFGEDFRLLEDIGWAPCESCQSFALTMPIHDLMDCSSACMAKPSGFSSSRARSAGQAKMTPGWPGAFSSATTPARKFSPTSTRGSRRDCRQRLQRFEGRGAGHRKAGGPWPVLLGAPQRADRACPCGSGLVYGRCHRRAIEDLSWVADLGIRHLLPDAVEGRLRDAA